MSRAILILAISVLSLATGIGCGITGTKVNQNLPPLIKGIAADGLIANQTYAQREAQITLTLTATDAENDALTYSWERTGGSLTSDGAVAVFQASANGNYTVRGWVSDGSTKVYRDINIQVVDFADGFETYVDGSPRQPSSPPWSFTGLTGDAAVESTTNVHHGEGAQSMELINRDASSTAVALAYASSQYSGTTSDENETVEFYVMLDGEGLEVACYQMPDTDTAHELWALGFRDGGLYAGASDPVASTDQNAWMKIRVQMYRAEKQWTVSFGDHAPGQTIDMVGGSLGDSPVCDGLMFSTPNVAGHYYIDDVTLTAGMLD